MMNKKLMLDYKIELDYFLKGGKVLMGKRDYSNGTVKWYPSISNPFIEPSESIVVVINDEYVEYRKALAEGKTVQYKIGTIVDTIKPKWQDLTPEEFNSYKIKDFWDKDLGNIKGVENYRIKPEKSKVEVGDWVINAFFGSSTTPFIFKQFHKGNSELWIAYCTRWKPKKDEWCWFYDSYSGVTVLDKLSYIDNENKYYSINNHYMEKYGEGVILSNCFDKCIPFIGELPPHLKETK